MDSLSEGGWVAVTNNDKGHHWYFGQIVSLDLENEELEVDFVKEPGDKNECRTFTKENTKCFVPRELVLRTVDPPTKVTSRAISNLVQISDFTLINHMKLIIIFLVFIGDVSTMLYIPFLSSHLSKLLSSPHPNLSRAN
jgi:hypothetical protein